MPHYYRKCSNCGFSEETSEKMSQTESIKCPQCQKKTFKRQISSGAAIIFRGYGFYETDYKNKS